MTHVVITGATGFIGSYVTREFLQHGHRVLALDAAPEPALIDGLISDEERSRVEIRPADIRDGSFLTEAIAGATAVIHLASALQRRSNQDPRLAVTVNCQGTLNVFESALAAGITRVVWASSVAVFGRALLSVPVANDAAQPASDIYGKTKSLTESIGAHFNRHYAMETVGLRFTVVYGFGRATAIGRGSVGGPVVDMVELPATGRSAPPVRSADSELDWLHVEDAARAVYLASQSPTLTSAGLSITGERATLRQAAGIVTELLPGTDFDLRPGERSDPYLDAGTARNEIGYIPQIPLRTGIRRYIEQVRQASPGQETKVGS
ncbi:MULTISPECIES: NAD(P)-dependent oxidoreductase [Rhodococcus]|uniref:NAD(P)-dependent oxidoreductase n=1 Tax=Rhodococcus oxybenzonivorans TaxID=1990687 RepID=A0AAE5A4L7_9NOCA|nr:MULTISPECIES: NAD(P)-dependent oxidoreductase [Rhodococcus]MDV7243353.1 NAD(P)-dependent oxidoreductase [Rhodococcus oxybenzonivorans]MDV7263945.1 NAD(P)-dependent oxidoreductase [Rhodococcus oxybenzonivorans]MDV7276781.1 NAD(P)-dependent oxidoreductase [Rhodococcus oxybenzonivorans]MDV7334387.1 NAD(P)-dependent oxidoreductase [Rhodococcus oxybenzonivorans]MDV7344542.1 NAD(P)-dependent oxidoreductase [Rhodococcus oxybenzonivorans]